MTSRPILKTMVKVNRLRGHVGTRRPTTGSRSPARRGDRQQLCAASPGPDRPAHSTDCRGASRTRWSAARPASASAAATGGTNPTLSAAGLCGLPRVRVSRADAPPSSAGRARACGRPISNPLEFIGGSPGDGTGILRSTLGARQGTRARTPPRRAGTEPADNRATGDPAARSPAAAPWK